jgi:hypothetical protein
MSRQFGYTMQEKIVKVWALIDWRYFSRDVRIKSKRLYSYYGNQKHPGIQSCQVLTFINDRKPGKYSLVFMPLIYKYVDAQLFQFCFHR